MREWICVVRPYSAKIYVYETRDQKVFFILKSLLCLSYLFPLHLNTYQGSTAIINILTPLVWGPILDVPALKGLTHYGWHY